MLGMMMHRPLLISDILKYAAEAYPQAGIISVRTEGDVHRQTYAETLGRVQQLANALQARGVQILVDTTACPRVTSAGAGKRRRLLISVLFPV